jgi:hypothetical protein
MEGLIKVILKKFQVKRIFIKKLLKKIIINNIKYVFKIEIGIFRIETKKKNLCMILCHLQIYIIFFKIKENFVNTKIILKKK